MLIKSDLNAVKDVTEDDQILL